MENIRIKGFKNGILIQYNEGMSFDEIVKVTRDKFTQSRKFFSTSTVSVKFEGVSLSEEQENILCEIITDSCDLTIACVITDDEEKNNPYDNSIHMVKDLMEKTDVLFYRGNVINGQILKSEKDIIIIGDVNPGCSVISAKNIYIFGGLYGEAYAGTGQKISQADESKIITALEIAPEELYIGTVRYNIQKKSIWGHKIKLQPSIAYVENKRVVVGSYSKELMDKINDR